MIDGWWGESVEVICVAAARNCLFNGCSKKMMCSLYSAVKEPKNSLGTAIGKRCALRTNARSKVLGMEETKGRGTRICFLDCPDVYGL